jgi:hypothetical protein
MNYQPEPTLPGDYGILNSQEGTYNKAKGGGSQDPGQRYPEILDHDTISASS